MDKSSSLVVHDWANGIEIMRTAVDNDKIFCLTYIVNDDSNTDDSLETEGGNGNGNSNAEGQPETATQASSTIGQGTNDVVVTGGVRHLAFWMNKGQNVKKQSGMWGHYKKETILCVTSPLAGVVVTGGLSGGLVIWDKYRASFQAHLDISGFAYPHIVSTR